MTLSKTQRLKREEEARLESLKLEEKQRAYRRIYENAKGCRMASYFEILNVTKPRHIMEHTSIPTAIRALGDVHRTKKWFYDEELLRPEHLVKLRFAYIDEDVPTVFIERALCEETYANGEEMLQEYRNTPRSIIQANTIVFMAMGNLLEGVDPLKVDWENLVPGYSLEEEIHLRPCDSVIPGNQTAQYLKTKFFGMP